MSSCVLGDTTEKTFATRPSEPTRNVVRCTPHVLLTVHRLLDPGTVGLGYRLIGVGKRSEVEIELVGELLYRTDLVRRNADHPRSRLAVVGVVVANAAGLGRAARRIGARIKIQYDRLALEIGKLDRIAVLVWQLEVGRFVACLEHRCRRLAQESAVDLNATEPPATISKR